jgi:hypothetical protein
MLERNFRLENRESSGRLESRKKFFHDYDGERIVDTASYPFFGARLTDDAPFEQLGASPSALL